MRGALLLALAAAPALACAPPADSVRYAPARVAIDDGFDPAHGWNADQRRALEGYLSRELDALGPDFVLVAPGEADVVVRPADLSALGPGVCGRFRSGERFVEVDPACAMGFDGTKKAAGHELGHWYLWNHHRYLGHVCRFTVNEPPPPGCHPTIVCPASGCLMEPGLRGPVSDGAEEDWAAQFADPTPTDADRALFERCARRGRCE